MTVDIRRFLTIARQQGMPVRMIHYVLGAYDFKTKKIGVNLVRRYLVELLEDDVSVLHRAELGNLTVTRMSGDLTNLIQSERDEVDTIYHEAAHAFCFLKLDLKSDDMFGMTAASVIRKAAEHYRGAKLENGKVTTKPEQVVHEVIGEYIGHRAATMWETLDELYYLIRHGKPGETLFRSYRSFYNTEMQKKLFGYESWGQDPNIEISRVTDRLIPDYLAEFCDRTLLEGKIPHRFDASPRLIALSHEAQKKITYGPRPPGTEQTAN